MFTVKPPLVDNPLLNSWMFKAEVKLYELDHKLNNLKLNELTNVSTVAPTSNQVLQWNGTTWLPGTVSGGGGGGSGDITEVVAGSGLTGGATSGSATLNIGSGSGITVNANDIEVDTSVTVTLGATQTLTAKTLTSPVIDTGVSGTAIDTDLTSTSASDDTLASAKAIKTYADTKLANIVEDTSPQLGGTLDANSNTIDMGSNTITDTKVGNWDTAHGWGNHASGGYLTSLGTAIVDADFSSNGLMKRTGAGTYSVVTDNSSNWDTAHGWGDHSSAGYLTSQTSHADVVVDGDFGSNGIMTRTGAGSYAMLTDNSSNWNTAYGWGDHSSGGYLTSLGTAIVDADFSSNGLMKRTGAGTYSIVTDSSSNWDTAFGWGNHASGGYQAALTFGIADTNAVKIDDADAADDDYARFTASGVEGRSYSEVKTDLSLDNVENTALSTWAGTANITTLGTLGQDVVLKTNDGAILTLQTSETTIVATDSFGSIQWQAPNEADGGRADDVAAKIEAKANTTFSNTTNSTNLEFHVHENFSTSVSLAKVASLAPYGRFTLYDSLPTTSGTSDPHFIFERTGDDNGAEVGTIFWKADLDNGTQYNYAEIQTKIVDSGVSAREGALHFKVSGDGSAASDVLKLERSLVTVTPALTVAADTDATTTLGRALIHSPLTDAATFSHLDKTSLSDYALLQNSSGATYINASSGQGIYFNNNNSNVVSINSSGLKLNPGKSIYFEGATADDFETFITVTDPTADRTITLPDATGTVLTTGNSDTPTTTTSSSDADYVLVDDGGVMKKITPGNLGIGGGGGSSAADDITVGDAAVTIATTTGDITIDAQGNDTDIIFKGTDNTADITMLTLDGSEGGTATFNSDIKLGDNGSVVFGASNDTSIVHDANNTLINHSGSGELKLQVGGADKLVVNASGVEVDDVLTTRGLAVTQQSKGISAFNYRYIRVTNWVFGSGGTCMLRELSFNTAADGTGTEYPSSDMTANNAPSPYVASASYEHSGGSYPAWKAFDGNVNGSWWTLGSSGGTTDYIQIDLGSSFNTNLNRIDININPSYPATGFTIYGSANGNFSGEQVIVATVVGRDVDANSGVTTLRSDEFTAFTFQMEGATPDANETTLAVIDPTADRTITLPDATGTTVLTGVTGEADITGGTVDINSTAGDITIDALGGNLLVNGNTGNMTFTNSGTGDILLGNFKFDSDQTVGAGQDNYVLTYDHSTTKISLEAAAGGGGGGIGVNKAIAMAMFFG